MNYDVINLENKVVGKISLNEEIFALQVRPDIIHRVVNYQLAARQQGTHKTKGISEISGTTRKPWKQKGTGRARQGSLRSPQFRGGATIFGPVVRSHAYSLNKKFRALGLKHALSSKNMDKTLIVVDSIDLSSVKTKDLKSKLNNLNLKSALFVDANKSEVFVKACSNIIGIDMIPVIGLNVYDIIRHEHLVITTDALNALEARLNGSNSNEGVAA